MQTRTAIAALACALVPLSSTPSVGAVGAEATAGVATTDGVDATADASARAEPDRTAHERERRDGLALQSTIKGATGLLHVLGADSGPPGTLRVSLLGNIYSGSAFLCPNCERPDGTVSARDDDVDVFGTRLLLSATPWAFLEASAAMR
jgi:hypothetical protein